MSNPDLKFKTAPRFGLGFRTPHFEEVVTTLPTSVDWFEIISENFFSLGGRSLEYLTKLKEHYPVACHGVGLSIASRYDLDKAYLDKLKRLIDFVNPLLVTDHLCWTGTEHFNSYDLLPVPYTERELSRIARRLDQIQNYLGRPIALENPSAYVAFADTDYSEAEFLAELCQRSSCGLLLDLNNLFVNHKNLGLDPLAYLNRLPPDSVWQFHVAGHSVAPNGFRIDTHDHALYPEVLALFEMASAKFVDAPVLLEWDDKIPQLATLTQELDFLRSHDRRPDVDRALPSRTVESEPQHSYVISQSALPTETYQDRFIDMLKLDAGVDASHPALGLFSNATSQPAVLGMNVYNQAYFLRLRDCLREQFTTVALVLDDVFDLVVKNFLITDPARSETIDQVCRAFSTFLTTESCLPTNFRDDQPVVADLAAFEWQLTRLFNEPDGVPAVRSEVFTDFEPEDWETLRVFFKPAFHLQAFRYPVGAVVRAGQQSAPLHKPAPQLTHYLLGRAQSTVTWQTVTEIEFNFATRLNQDKSFYAAALAAFKENGGGLGFTDYVQIALRLLMTLVAEGLVEKIDLKADLFQVAVAECESPSADLSASIP